MPAVHGHGDDSACQVVRCAPAPATQFVVAHAAPPGLMGWTGAGRHFDPFKSLPTQVSQRSLATLGYGVLAHRTFVRPDFETFSLQRSQTIVVDSILFPRA